jgi:hypothetical protein
MQAHQMGGVMGKIRAEQPSGADCLQRPLLRRSRFRQQVSASVQLLKLHRMHCLKNVA